MDDFIFFVLSKFHWISTDSIGVLVFSSYVVCVVVVVVDNSVDWFVVNLQTFLVDIEINRMLLIKLSTLAAFRARACHGAIALQIERERGVKNKNRDRYCGYVLCP